MRVRLGTIVTTRFNISTTEIKLVCKLVVFVFQAQFNNDHSAQAKRLKHKFELTPCIAIVYQTGQ